MNLSEVARGSVLNELNKFFALWQFWPMGFGLQRAEISTKNSHGETLKNPIKQSMNFIMVFLKCFQPKNLKMQII